MLNGFSEIIINNYVLRAKHFEHFLCARPCVKQFTLNTQQPCKQSSITTFISQKKKLRCNEDKSLSQGPHRTQIQSQESNTEAHALNQSSRDCLYRDTKGRKVKSSERKVLRNCTLALLNKEGAIFRRPIFLLPVNNSE